MLLDIVDHENKDWTYEPNTEGVYGNKFIIENNIIYFGNKSFPEYHSFAKASSNYPLLSDISGIAITRGIKDFNKQYTEKMQITPSATIRVLNKLMFKVWIAPFGRDVVWAYARQGSYKRSLCGDKLKQLHDKKEIVETCLQDNQKNLIPLCVHLGKTPKELKDSLDRATWKKVVHTSLTKSALLAHYLRMSKTTLDSTVVNIPSGLIKYSLVDPYALGLYDYGEDWQTKGKPKACYQEVVQVIANLCRKARILSKNKEIKRIASTVADTYSLAEKLDLKVNPNWSKTRFHEQHDIFAKEITARRYSPEPFTHSWMDKLPTEYVKDGCKARLLISRNDVATEGLVMHHCVASYAEHCATGRYAVYSVTDVNSNKSTLGLTLYEDKVTIQQHYRAFNQSVEKHESEFARELILSINNNQEKI